MPDRDPYRYFRIESRDLAAQLGRGVAALAAGGDGAGIAALLRLAHTLKGAARVVGLADIAGTAHRIEDLLAPFRAGDAPVPQDTTDALMELVDEANRRIDALAAPEATLPDRAAARALPIPDNAGIVHVDPASVDAVLEGLGEARSHLAALSALEAETGLLRRLAESLPGETDAGEPGLAIGEMRRLAAAIERDLEARIGRAEGELRQASEAAEQLRLMPAAALFPTLERAALDAARVLGKRVEVWCSGGNVRLDAQAARPLLDALTQLVRNAVAHGIEPDAERVAAGKVPPGRLDIELAARGRRIVVRCTDDGRGIDEAALERRLAAADRPLPSTREASARLVDLLLAGGVSTSEKVTHVAGRGIGMDIVRDAVERMRAELSITTTPGEGTTFELSLPLTLSLVEALLLEAGGETVAVPLDAVVRTSRLAPKDIETTSAGEIVADGGTGVPFVTLERLLWQRHARPQRPLTAVWLRTGLVLGVDHLVGTAPAVVRALPPLAPAAPSVAGVWLTVAARPVLMLDPEGALAVLGAAGPPPAPEAAPRPRLLVVDDSLTTRMLEQSILAAAGYEVDVATSGEEGLARVRQGDYALVLCDVEMPGMDGFSVVEALRRDEERRHLPVILVTSRDAPEDRARGLAVGAQGYVVKSEFDQAELLGRIEQLVA